MDSEITSQILSFARHLDTPGTDPRHTAMQRQWIDAAGKPTPEGLRLAQSLRDQSGTRSTFRNM